MNNNRIQMNYYATYYYSNIIDGVLSNQFEYLRSLNEFYGEGNAQYYVSPFRKLSAYHEFIYFIIDSVLWEEVKNLDVSKMKNDYQRFRGIPEAIIDLNLCKLPIEQHLNAYNIEHEDFLSWLKSKNADLISASIDEPYEYYQELLLNGEIETLINKIRDEVFIVTFSNRSLLKMFNEMMASAIEMLDIRSISKENSIYFRSNGTLKRHSIPQWVKKAVFYRDRGRCVICNKDLSGVLSMQNNKNFDHIVPLALYGLNDVSNIQLLCESCNGIKRHYSTETSHMYEKWY